MSSTKRTSTRQKMINLMYLVFIAMLALKISTEVLDGFDLINDNIQKTIKNTANRNNQLYAELNEAYKSNPQKASAAYNLSQTVKQRSDSLYNYIQTLKYEVAVRTDGKDADVDDLKTKDNIDAASEVFLAPNGGKGKEFKEAIDNYRINIASLISDPNKKALIEEALSTESSERAKKQNKNWLQACFDNMPSVAVITYLSELQSNVRQAEGEVLNSIIKEIDFSDFRVNSLDAIVIPESKVVVSGASYKAHIVVAAVDTTQRPQIVVNGKEIENGLYQIATGRTGQYKLEGYIDLKNRDGSSTKRQFSDSYTVIEPMATVAPLLMDVVYLGIENEMSISVPGFTPNEVGVSVQGGSIIRKGNNWVAKPTGKVGDKFVVNVSVKTNGVQRSMAHKEFRIRALPDPSAFINYVDSKGASRIFKQGTLSRNALLNAGNLRASIDDGILNIPFTVLSFRIMVSDAMGNVVPEVSAGASFSSRQLELIRRLDRGKTFFIAGIKVKGPDGIERDIAPMEIRLN